jgi:hypothetical protein
VVGDRRHLLAWLLIVDGVFPAVYNLAAQYAPLAFGLTSRRLSLPGGDLASWLTGWTNVPGIVILAVFLILLSPDGRLPSHRWWPLAWGRRRDPGRSHRHPRRRVLAAARAAEAFSIRLRDQVDLDTLSAELLAAVDQTMQPASASLWLRPSA